ncbi:MAG: hypothetical protein ABF856_07795 [Acetobacter aceti]|uniref:hypothetical protein n=1 Tax=Acetobacter aceti TaxID=435 RepID=UPI0011EA5BAD|nr:hypothetical protein [Acetobacter aceti]
MRPQASSTGCLAPFDVDCVVGDLDTLGERPNVIPPIAALSVPEPTARLGRQFPHRRAREGVVRRALEHGFDPGGRRPAPDSESP